MAKKCPLKKVKDDNGQDTKCQDHNGQQVLSKKASRGNKLTKPAQKAKIHRVMSEFKNKELNIGKSPKKVTNRKQAVAIALSEARRIGKKKKK